MATVNMLYTCTAGYKNEKPNDDDGDDGGGFFLLSTLSAIDMHSVSWAINSIFIFILVNDDIFIYVSLSLLILEHTPHPHNKIVFIFGFCYFSLHSFLFIVENQLSFGIFDWLVDRSVLHWLKQYQCAYYTPCWIHTLKPYHFGEEMVNWWWCSSQYKNAEI